MNEEEYWTKIDQIHYNHLSVVNVIKFQYKHCHFLAMTYKNCLIEF